MRIQAFDFSVDLLQALLWQYNDADNLRGLLECKQAWYEQNHTAFWENWIRDVFDLRTANDFGLSVWAEILGVPLAVTVDPTKPGTPVLGFGGSNRNFGHGGFGCKSSSTVGLTVEQKRTVLRLRYFQLVSRGTIPEINQFMKMLLGVQGQVYVLDPNDMTYVVYVFTFQPNPGLTFVLDTYDLLPRPAGVGVRRIVVNRPSFGFGEYNKNFEHGTFPE